MNPISYYTGPAHGAKVTSPFGMRDDPLNPGTRRMHNGVDFGGKPRGYVWTCYAPGVVTHIGDHGARGKVVVVASLGDKVNQIYQHLDAYLVTPGTRVVQGSPIGTNGTTGKVTGPHLHFELRVQDGSTLGSPVWGDPAQYRGGGGEMKEYTVKSGDTLGKIASTHGISPWTKLVEWNKDRYPDIGTGSNALVRVGWVLRLQAPEKPVPVPQPTDLEAAVESLKADIVRLESLIQGLDSKFAAIKSAL